MPGPAQFLRRRKLKKLWQRLKTLQAQRPSYERLLLELGAAKKAAGRGWFLIFTRATAHTGTPSSLGRRRGSPAIGATAAPRSGCLRPNARSPAVPGAFSFCRLDRLRFNFGTKVVGSSPAIRQFRRWHGV